MPWTSNLKCKTIMDEQDIPQEDIDLLLRIMRDDDDDRIIFEDYESPSGSIANREVACPDGYVFHAFIIIPEGEQIVYAKAEKALDKQTAKSFQFLLARDRGGLRELLQ